MPTVSQGSEVTIDLAAADAYQVSIADGGDAYVDLLSGAPGAPYESPRLRAPTTSKVFGPYGVAARIRIRAVAGSVTYTPYKAPQEVAYNPATGGLESGGSPVSGAGNSAAPTEFPAERVTMAATGCVCASPCQIERIRCVSGTTVALTVYDNPAASSGTQLYSGTLSAGQEAPISDPIRAINGLRAVFASGSFDFHVSQKA